MHASHIPSYHRYGEAEPKIEPDLLHCQAIFSRISEQDWEIRPHRHSQLYQIFMVEEGELETLIETSRFTLFAPCALLVPAGRVHGFGYGEGVRGRMISVSDGFLRGALEASRAVRWMDAIKVVHFSGDDGGFEHLAGLFSAVELEARQRSPGYVSALSALLQLLFVHLDRHASHENAGKRSSEEFIRFEQFRDLVIARFRSHLPVSAYCDRLAIGERRLNRICRAMSGESPLAYIHRHIMEEAKRYLVHTAMPVSSVGYELGFADSAYFSRFFRKHAGISPSKFAAQHRG